MERRLQLWGGDCNCGAAIATVGRRLQRWGGDFDGRCGDFDGGAAIATVAAIILFKTC
jgi:hypothetical protein